MLNHESLGIWHCTHLSKVWTQWDLSKVHIPNILCWPNTQTQGVAGATFQNGYSFWPFSDCPFPGLPFYLEKISSEKPLYLIRLHVICFWICSKCKREKKKKKEKGKGKRNWKGKGKNKLKRKVKRKWTSKGKIQCPFPQDFFFLPHSLSKRCFTIPFEEMQAIFAS